MNKGKKYTNYDFDDFIELSHEWTEENGYLDCNIEIEIDGQVFKAHEVSICYHDLLFFTDKGTLNYVVDSYGDRLVAELFNWDLDEGTTIN